MSFRDAHPAGTMQNSTGSMHSTLETDRDAAEGALPYPPGVLCVVPGEIWGDSVLRYFTALEEGINLLPGFAPELQGVYIEECDGRKQVRCYVIKQPAAQPVLLKGEIL